MIVCQAEPEGLWYWREISGLQGNNIKNQRILWPEFLALDDVEMLTVAWFGCARSVGHSRRYAL